VVHGGLIDGLDRADPGTGQDVVRAVGVAYGGVPYPGHLEYDGALALRPYQVDVEVHGDEVAVVSAEEVVGPAVGLVAELVGVDVDPAAPFQPDFSLAVDRGAHVARLAADVAPAPDQDPCGQAVRPADGREERGEAA